ncbi:MAG: C1 family peptidase [Polyangiaceae bacterium]
MGPRPISARLFLVILALTSCGEKKSGSTSSTSTTSSAASTSSAKPSATAATSSTAPSSAPAAGASPAAKHEETDDECKTGCAKDATENADKYCGTDGKTYPACDWVCDLVPAGVGVYPGECGADGKPSANHPPSAADGKVICDWFPNGSDWIAVECEEATEDTNPSRDFGAKGVAPSADLQAAAGPLPDEISHRARYGSIKNQGSAPACISFASTAALEGAVAAETGSHIILSELHFLSHYHTTRYQDAIRTLQTGTVLEELADAEGFKYDSTVAAGWLKGEEAPDETKVKDLDGKIAFEVAAVHELGPEGGNDHITADQMAHAIADGEDLMVGFRMSDNWYSQNLLPGGVIEDYDEGRNFGHAVLLVGFKNIGGKSYFEIRNSWGSAWGDAGYGYISFPTAEANLQVAASVVVRRNSDVLVENCAEGQAAGFDGKCRKICPDGALEEEGGCKDLDSACREGLTKDASGVCVRECAQGDREFDDLKVSCKGDGCVWTIPGGTHGCTAATGEFCEHFCRAPDCEMVEGKNEFGVAVLGCGAE